MAIYAGGDHTVGLCADGTVVAVGDNEYGQCNVSTWSGIVALAAGGRNTLGLMADGLAVSSGEYNLQKYGPLDISRWKNIKLPNA